MGLLDVFNGMQNGPRGNRGLGGGGMSPITMALLGLLAYKAVKSFRGDTAQAGLRNRGLLLPLRAAAASAGWAISSRESGRETA